MATAQQNPLMQFVSLPAYSQVRVEHIMPAVTEAIENCKNTIMGVVDKNKDHPTWDNVISPIEEAEDRFSKVWSVVSHLNMVKNSPEFREEHDKCLPLIAEYNTFSGQYKPLYEVLTKIAQSDEFSMLTAAQRKSIENQLRDFRLTGVDLNEEEKQTYLEISKRLSQLQSDFANNVLDATKGYTLTIKQSQSDRLGGLPESILNQTLAIGKEKGIEGHVFTLDMPIYLPTLTYADDRDLRRELYIAYVTRASDKGPLADKFDNANNIDEILSLRHQIAKLLGFNCYAELSLATKMAKDPSEVMDFLTMLADKCREKGKSEIKELEEFAKTQGLVGRLEPWDVAYYSEKLKQKQFSYNAEELRKYFPVDKVMGGLFECAGRVFSISFRPHLGVDVWDEEVRCVDVYDDTDTKIGTFFVDLYTRDGKRGGAWMDECMSRRYRADGSLQLPVAYLVCNFTPPLEGKESLLTHDEVITLFHEFGHSLNLLLTKVDIASVSGINGVPWDAVELPSQFNENFAWQEEVLNFLSGSVEDGSPLPKNKLNALIRAKNFHSAMAMLRQLEFALFDFRIHLEYTLDAQNSFVDDVLRDVREHVAVAPQYPENRFKDSFSHIFAGGYAAGYYSYKWAEVLAADAFGRFEEEGIFKKEVGDAFRDYIMASGGAVDPMKSFVAFRGRKPTVDALLRQSGIIS